MAFGDASKPSGRRSIDYRVARAGKSCVTTGGGSSSDGIGSCDGGDGCENDTRERCLAEPTLAVLPFDTHCFHSTKNKPGEHKAPQDKLLLLFNTYPFPL